MYGEIETGSFAKPCQHLAKAGGRHRRVALRHEHVATMRVVPAKLAQRPQLTPGQGMRAWLAVLRPPDVQQMAFEIDLIPCQRAQLRNSQTVPIGQQHRGRVAVSPPVALRGVDQPINLGQGQVLAGPDSSVRPPTRRAIDCPILVFGRIS